jgi:hypothetical protein
MSVPAWHLSISPVLSAEQAREVVAAIAGAV